MHRQDLSMLPGGCGWLLVEFGGETKEEAGGQAHDLMAELKRGNSAPKGMKLYDDPEAEQHVWGVREAGLGATAFLPGKADAYEGWEDSAVPPERVGEYLRELGKLAGKYGYESALYGHYGQGCIHARWNFDLKTAHGIETYRRFLDEASDLVLGLGGSLSGEHGDGQSRAELLPKMFGEELVEAFREFKSIWEPDWKMNPRQGRRSLPDHGQPPARHRLGPAAGEDALLLRGGQGQLRPRDDALRRNRQVPPHRGRRHVPELHGHSGGEAHHARACAPALGDTERRGARRLARQGGLRGARPLPLVQGLHERLPGERGHADAEGGVPLALLRGPATAADGVRVRPDRPGGSRRLPRAGARQLRHADGAARRGGQARARDLPEAPDSALRAADAEGLVRGAAGGHRLVLWADTFTNYFEVEVGVAAVEALEDAGFHVVVPQLHLCCGRPLYDYGMLGLARRYAEKVIDHLREDIHVGVPVVGIEPSCVAVFKDELPKLLTLDEDAERLAKQTFQLSEFLARLDGYEPPALQGNALLHGHCHHKATGGIAPERELLEKMGLEVEELDSGCCGMAGGWGYEHYDVSMACGERVLLPRVREASPETLVVADGFSCKSQIEQGAPCTSPRCSSSPASRGRWAPTRSAASRVRSRAQAGAWPGPRSPWAQRRPSSELRSLHALLTS